MDTPPAPVLRLPGLATRPADLVRLPGRSPETKDPCVLRRPDGGWVMYASVGWSDVQDWLIGRFLADSPEGPWVEAEPVRLDGLSGPTVCAPAVVLEDRPGEPAWTMYVQTDCFREGGHIARATSRDGCAFVAGEPAATPGGHALLYDVGVRRVAHRGRTLRVMLYTACSRVGCGDLWGSVMDESSGEGWSAPRQVLAQGDVPWHNQPHDPHYEWALEGAEVVQIGDGMFLMVGVCFLPLGAGTIGSRQRVFFAAGREPLGPFTPMGVAVGPRDHGTGAGETGHPSAVVDGDVLHLFYQERAGDGPPWHLRQAWMPLDGLRAVMAAALDGAGG
jgi:hypothetical protein